MAKKKPAVQPELTAQQSQSPSEIDEHNVETYQGLGEAINLATELNDTKELPSNTPTPPEEAPPAPEESDKGWYDMQSAPTDGTHIFVCEDLKDGGDDGFPKKTETTYWRKTRRRATGKLKWEEYGYWAGSLTNRPIEFVPGAWRARYV